MSNALGAAQRLYERFQQLIHEAAKFGTVGIVLVLVNNVIYAWMHSRHHIGPVTSSVVSAAITTVMSFIANRFWSFRHREGNGMRRETILFFVLNGVGIVIQSGVVAVAYHAFGLRGWLVNVIALNFGIALATIFRFWSYRKFVWPTPQPAAADHEQLEPAKAGPPS